MADTGMESYVNCPECGQQVWVVMKNQGKVLKEAIGKDSFLNVVQSVFGVGNSDYFIGEGKCQCGKHITATLRVTVEAAK